MEHLMQVPADQDLVGWAITVRSHDIELWRRKIATMLRAWGAPRSAVELGRLGVSELLGNVVKHLDDRRCLLMAFRKEEAAIVAVVDHSSDLPQVNEPKWDAESGRGLWMLQQMAASWGCERLTHGKAVWFRCDLTRSATR